MHPPHNSQTVRMLMTAVMDNKGRFSVRYNPLTLLTSIAHRWLLHAFRIRQRGYAAPPIKDGLHAHQVQFPTANGKNLIGWWCDPGQRGTVVVMMHGWGANASHLFPLAQAFVAAGHPVLLFDARCHGLSDDDGFASLPRFSEDILAALHYLASLGHTTPLLLGHSVGAGAALLAATRWKSLQGVVSISAFAHPQEMMRRCLRGWHIPYWPIGGWLLRHVQRIIGHRFDDIAPIHTIRQLEIPLLLIHGEADTTVPVADAQRLHRANPLSELFVLPEAGHNRVEELLPHTEQLLAWIAALNPTAISRAQSEPIPTVYSKKVSL
ncbi:dipeptidyl aminopeptidases/acylaminoacyl-peptidases-like protein [Magnetococcus marinus MC-1]|uniref:Dipeptidyl aminopeptidases/acylaminoacyl-peptidases-like protein n=1 Tax=Magnetococcus marinus (strain ATCC BAA-1437 / JCM 17883 / MC-1) TaxID=156889 RepID=A0LC45_MAGMM|nr:alpha/beta fold hydrolase [Magnetococcus marinus]ABK45538.1 dipeptidyl aminopeptidases/acylaminoacyl-peptidases-like protein [Magnetococcus marinus MC-1]